MGNVPDGAKKHFPSFARQAERISKLNKNTLTITELGKEMVELSRRMEEELGVICFFNLYLMANIIILLCFLVS
jgi:hypothetical protein